MADIHIEVKIGNRSYPLSIDDSEQEKVKVAVQLINDNINKLKGNYVVTDYVDLLAMTALELALGAEDVSSLKDSATKKTLDNDLLNLESKLDKVLMSGESS
jgi:cell division protein ZapA